MRSRCDDEETFIVPEEPSTAEVRLRANHEWVLF